MRVTVSWIARSTDWRGPRNGRPYVRCCRPLTGLNVVDLGCGFGWFCRYVGEQGAKQICGYDLSEKMLLRARSMTIDPAINYVRADLETLQLPPASADLVYSSLAFHYVENLPALFTEVHRALVPGGQLVFSMEHPIYMASAQPGWMAVADGRKIWPVDRYLVEGPRITDWLAPGVVKHHRTLGTTVTALISAGFTLEQLNEFAPSREQIVARPELAEELERPMFVLVKARR